MKLLFDENLSPRLAKALADIFPDSMHVHLCGLSDFRLRAELEGHPPKVIWVNAGNRTTAEIERLL